MLNYPNSLVFNLPLVTEYHSKFLETRLKTPGYLLVSGINDLASLRLKILEWNTLSRIQHHVVYARLVHLSDQS